ncbi:MAG: hypothetical protein ACRDRS_19350 [Pseudonocardiaceae bacterium]
MNGAHHDLDVQKKVPTSRELLVEPPSEPVGGLLMLGGGSRGHQQDAFLEFVPAAAVLW